jgi:hypothetical protein
VSAGTAVGDYANVKSVEYVQQELPSSMMNAIRIIERLLTQSKYHEQHVLYKDYPAVNLNEGISESVNEDDEGDGKGFRGRATIQNVDEEKDEKEEEEEVAEKEKEDPDAVRLKHLFKFECDVTEGRNISCMDFNMANPDLLAVAYGEFDMDETKQMKTGIIAFWTLKNPQFPEKIIRTEFSVTCCEFSKRNPNFIACGDSHGGIAIFDVTLNSNKPIAESKDLDGKHTDIVWEVHWIDRAEKGEILVSISGDGKVIEWSMKKGLEYTELMQLKRQANPNQKDSSSTGAAANGEGKKGGMTFINTGGMSIDFPTTENSTYYASTEDSTIYKCSVSYSEQYLDTYYGHSGPVYRVRCNPFWSQECMVFMTCSYDWTVRIWNARENTEKLVCQTMTLQEQVNDIEWSPDTSSVFASVANDGRIEIWDLYKNNLEPLLCWYDKGVEKSDHDATPKTVVRFSRKSPVIATGNTKGTVDVYRTFGKQFSLIPCRT